MAKKNPDPEVARKLSTVDSSLIDAIELDSTLKLIRETQITGRPAGKGGHPTGN